MPKILTRTVNLTNVRTRDADENGTRQVTGYASVFNSPTIIAGYYEETIAPGAFSRTLAENNDIRALFNHDTGEVLGRTKAGTLSLQEDDHGLAFTLDLPDTQRGRDLAVLMERGDVNQCSFGFWPTVEEWDYSDPDQPKDTVRECDLMEISIVTFPAYDDTEANLVRSDGQDVTLIKRRAKLIKQINEVIEK